MKPVYQEEIKAAYGGEPKGVHFHRPGKNVIEFIKPETPVANFKFNYDNYTLLTSLPYLRPAIGNIILIQIFL